MPSSPTSGPHAIVRDGHARQCSARTRSGARCRQFAVLGMSVCRMHGGASPQARAAAQRRKAAAEATVMIESFWDPSAAPVTDPVEALASLAGRTQHTVDVLGARVSVGDLDGSEALAFLRLVRELRQMLEGLDRLGLEERRVRIAEQAGHQLAAVVRAVLARLELTDDQQVLALTVVPEEFRRLGDEDATVVRGELG